MKKDITSRNDIVLLVDEFYKKIKEDDLLGFIFTDIAKVDWTAHLPIMYDFFENILFYTGPYTGNPMELHKHVNQLFPLTDVHFSRWIELFNNTVDELFKGEMALLVKQRAFNIANIMKEKISNQESLSDKIF